MLSMERNAFFYSVTNCVSSSFLKEKYEHCNLSNSTRHELPYVTVR